MCIRVAVSPAVVFAEAQSNRGHGHFHHHGSLVLSEGFDITGTGRAGSLLRPHTRRMSVLLGHVLAGPRKRHGRAGENPPVPGKKASMNRRVDLFMGGTLETN